MASEFHEGQSPHETGWTPEAVRQLPGRIHDSGIARMLPHYQLGPEKTPYLYHTYHDLGKDGTPTGDGHVASVLKLWQLYKSAVEWRMKEADEAFPRKKRRMKEADEAFPRKKKTDPLRLYSESEHYSFLSKNRMAYQKDNPDKPFLWKRPPENRKKDLIDLTFETSIMIHDLANVVEAVNWQKIKEEEGQITASSVVPRQEIYSGEGVETQAAAMYKQYIHTFASELGLLDEREAEYVASLGSDYIRKTDPEYGLVRPLHQLSLFDQTAAIISPAGFKGVIGLLNEEAASKRPDKAGGSRQRDLLFRDFTINQWKNNQYEIGISLEQFLDFLDEYRKANQDDFARILGSDAAQVPSLRDFLLGRLELGRDMAQRIWPDPEIGLEKAFAFDKPEEFTYIKEACAGFKDRFWDPTLQAEDF